MTLRVNFGFNFKADAIGLASAIIALNTCFASVGWGAAKVWSVTSPNVSDSPVFELIVAFASAVLSVGLIWLRLNVWHRRLERIMWSANADISDYEEEDKSNSGVRSRIRIDDQIMNLTIVVREASFLLVIWAIANLVIWYNGYNVWGVLRLYMSIDPALARAELWPILSELWRILSTAWAFSGVFMLMLQVDPPSTTLLSDKIILVLTRLRRRAKKLEQMIQGIK